MVELFQLIPLPLGILIIVLIILPTIFTAIVHIRLYNYLIFLSNKVRRLINRRSAGQKPRIIEDLEVIFQEASQNLEEVNTAELVDGIYSQEKFDFLGFRLRCHQWDYFSQALPSLLISFGLFGTFLGITINLSTLIQKVNQVKTTDINKLIEQLQDPIQGMEIAFITSLIAVACSSLLTVVNLRWNNDLAREDLISYLEDYLDNILQPKINNNSQTLEILTAEIKNINQNYREVLELHQTNQKSLQKIIPKFQEGANNFESTSQIIQDLKNEIKDREKNLVNIQLELTNIVKILKKNSQEVNTESQKFYNNLIDNIPQKVDINNQQIQEVLEKFQESISSLDNLGDHLNNTLVEQIGKNNQEVRKLREKIEDSLGDLSEIKSRLEQLELNFDSKVNSPSLSNAAEVRESDLQQNRKRRVTRDFFGRE